MAASIQFQTHSEHLRLLLLDMGLHFSTSCVSDSLKHAELDCLRRLSQAIQQENILSHPIQSDCVDDFMKQLRVAWQAHDDKAHFFPWKAFAQELHESISNQCLALLHRLQWHQQLKQLAKDTDSLWAWVITNHSPQASLEFFEQWGSIGHHYHPNFKAKMGLSRQEVVNFSPEFQTQVDIPWCALHKDCATTTHMDEEYEQVLKRAFPQVMKRWQASLCELGYDTQQYIPLPIHPWQQQHKVPFYFASLIEQGHLILLSCHQATKPSMSFRTVMSETGLHIKLPTAVHTTSAMRTVSAASVHNGPRLSRLINKLLSTHAHYQASLYLLADLAGAHLGGQKAYEDAKHLATILRQNPSEHLTEGETALPVASLFATSPITHQALLIEIITHSGLSPQDYLTQVTRLLLKSQLHLFLKYGIALESHQQNTLLVFKNHRVSKVLLRDLGGIRIDPATLQSQGLAIDLYPNSIIESPDLTAVRHKFIHANFQSNLGFIINLLSQHYSLRAKSLWRLVKHELLNLLDDIESHIDPDVFSEQKQALLHHPWQQKCLMRMRLEPHDDYILKPIANPLSEA